MSEGADLSGYFFLANFTLPDVGDFLDEVLFIELQREEADKLVRQYNEEGRKAGPPPEKRFDNRGGGFRGRGGGGGFQRYDSRGPPGGNRGGFQNRGGGGNSGGGGGNYRGGKAFASSSLSLEGQAVGEGWRESLPRSLRGLPTALSPNLTALEPFPLSHMTVPSLFAGLPLLEHMLL